ELLTDSVSLLVPSTAADITQAIGQLRIAKLLHGFRGQPAANIKAIVDTVMAVQSFVIEHVGRIEEVEINPLLCTPENAIAADALIRLGKYDDG
ncbi:MAG: acetate--CoA ligase family protein, partial [Proteobacteria bacterium]|nr:acetate--CoA ligase family protein [Pseudomonadota bacterium]